MGVQTLFGRGEFQLCQLALGDVARRTKPFDDFASCILKRDRARERPAQAAINAQDPVLQFEYAPGSDRFVDDRRHVGLIFRMNGDGGELLFSRGDDRRMRLLVQAPSGGAAKTVLDTDGPKFPTDWSSDGRFITFVSQWPDYRDLHIWTVELRGTSQTALRRAFLQHSCTELSAAFSPADRGKGPRWIAYTSDETGRNEVYVRDFPGGNQKWKVSTQGGGLPHWRDDGRELFYLALDGTLMATPVNPGDKFASGTPQALFATGLPITPEKTYINQYAPSRDGRRFLVNRRIEEPSPGAITAIVPR